MSTQPQVLKSKHSLIGKSLIPVVTKVKAWNVGDDLPLARLKKEYPLEDYSLVELRTEFEKLTGESVKDVLPLTGKDDNLDAVKVLMHFAIVQANLTGAPKGQPLTATATAQSLNSEGVTTEGTGTANDTVQQLKVMRQDLDALKNQKEAVQVDEALATVRTLASRPKLTSPNVLMAAIENLVDIANKTGHKDATMFSKSLSTCKKYEENEDFCSLVLKLFGSQEDKKISSIIADWAKAKKYESEKAKEKVKENTTPSGNPYVLPGMSFPQPYPLPYGYPPVIYPGPQFQTGASFYGPRMPARGGRGRRPKSNMTCYFCKESGHFVATCPKLKKD